MVGWEDFMAGWIAGLNGLVAGHPWDTIKVRQQILQVSLIKAATLTVKFEGVRGLYKGFLPPMLMIGPSNSIFFGSYGNMMKILQDNEQGSRILLDDPLWRHKVFWAGCVAGVFQVFATAPMEQVKTLLQVQTGSNSQLKSANTPKYTGVIDCFKKIYSIAGVRGLYRGTVPMLWRDVPTSGMYTLTYEVLLTVTYPIEWLNKPLPKQILAGGTAGFSVLALVPIDVVKTKVHSDDFFNPKFTGMKDCIYKSYSEYGPKVFVKGYAAVTIRAFPTYAVVLTTYEYVRWFLYRP